MPVVLYAPNGMMKTSLAKSIHDYIRGEKPSDKINPEKSTVFEIKDENDTDILPENLFVIDSINEKYQSEKLSTLLASEDLKKQYDEIFGEIGKKKDSLVSKLKKISGLSKDIEKVFASDYTLPEKQFLTALARLEREVNNDKYIQFSSFKYKILFNDDVEKFLSNKTFQDLIEEYTTVYDKILDNSKYFKKGVFNHTNAETIAKNLKSNGWFDGGHTVKLNYKSGGIEILNETDLTKAIENEKSEILSDETLKSMFSKVDKALSNAKLKEFREYLITNPSLVSELKNIPFLKNKIWIGYLATIKDDYLELLRTYDYSEEKIKTIISKAEGEQTRWESVIDIFNERFSVPFEVKIENKGDAVLNIDSPQITFYVKDELGNPTKKVARSLLDQTLSMGEKRALYILNIIFEVEARQKSNLETLFVVDDIADSFDYKNKYAIVEYLNDMRENNIFHLLIMTHNFDFYRTIKSRLSVYGDNKILASKVNNTIKIKKDELGDNPFIFWKKNLDKPRFFMASIPFIRNIAEYVGNEEAFIDLTALLHIKPNTKSITVSKVKQIYESVLHDNSSAKVLDSDASVIEEIFDFCQNIVNLNEHDIPLEEKVILSIGIRLRAEELMISEINNKSVTDTITKNQGSVR